MEFSTLGADETWVRDVVARAWLKSDKARTQGARAVSGKKP